MIGPAPADFWDRIEDKVARLIAERELALPRAAPRASVDGIPIESATRLAAVPSPSEGPKPAA
jgi:hypothetical protein